MEVLPLDVPTIAGLLRLGCAEEFADAAPEDFSACSDSRKIKQLRSKARSNGSSARSERRDGLKRDCKKRHQS